MFRLLLSGVAVALLAPAPGCFGQAATPAPTVEPAPPVELTPRPVLLKLGLNAGRALTWGGYDGLLLRLPLTLGAEYALGPRFSVYGQLDADLRFSAQQEAYGDRHFVLPSGALGVGARYYYNQRGRARHHRQYGRFVGNYLGLELHSELRRRPQRPDEFGPALNVVWGMQRRLGQHLLLDFNAGLGMGTSRSLIYHNGQQWGPSGQLNLNFLFGW